MRINTPHPKVNGLSIRLSAHICCRRVSVGDLPASVTGVAFYSSSRKFTIFGTLGSDVRLSTSRAQSNPVILSTSLVDSTNPDVDAEMWRVLREDIVRQWRCETGADPDVSEDQITVYSFHGDLDVRHCPEERRVKLTLHHYGDAQDRHEEQSVEYEVAITPEGERYWRRGNFKHGVEGMGRLVIYHLLKYRAPEEAMVLVPR